MMFNEILRERRNDAPCPPPSCRTAIVLLSAKIDGCGGGNSDCDFQPCRRQKRTEIGLSEFGYRNPIRGSNVRTPLRCGLILLCPERHPKQR